MEKKTIAYLIVNFGGPRNIPEVKPFLQELLTDQDVVRTNLPKWIHQVMFRRIASKRAKKVAHDYESIGGKSPIFEDTEELAAILRQRIEGEVLTFHRYLPAAHVDFLEAIQHVTADEIRIFPLFPQFTYATSGSIARWFDAHLPAEVVAKMRWVKSYPAHPAFLHVHQQSIRHFLQQNRIPENDVCLLFSAHGIPKKFVVNGDLYEDECRASFQGIMEGLPNTVGVLAYQSKFGPGEWLRPYTIDVCEEIDQWRQGRSHIVFIPVSFTSDHIETLYEIEHDYLPVVQKQGLHAYRLPALTLNPNWLDAIVEILQSPDICNNQMLIRR